jgi:hypothetical protein
VHFKIRALLQVDHFEPGQFGSLYVHAGGGVEGWQSCVAAIRRQSNRA